MAFDKFMNLVLADVEETYTVRMRIERTETQLRLKPSNAEPSGEHTDLLFELAKSSCTRCVRTDSEAGPIVMQSTILLLLQWRLSLGRHTQALRMGPVAAMSWWRGAGLPSSWSSGPDT